MGERGSRFSSHCFTFVGTDLFDRDLRVLYCLRQDWPSLYRHVSYEVGGDVFSLQELEHCVLRGKLPRPRFKDCPKRFAPLPPEGDDHYAYSLEKVSQLLHLFLSLIGLEIGPCPVAEWSEAL